MSGTLYLAVWFLDSVFIKKTWRALIFFFSSSNRNRGKSVDVISKKNYVLVSRAFEYIERGRGSSGVVSRALLEILA
jgi:hypothetical protein